MEQKKFRAEHEKPLPTTEQLEAEIEAMGGFDEEPGSIVWLSVNELYPHPNNPRKELGDLTELSASIRKNGVMQNLTVVKRDGFGYTVIIGHRRCAAAKLAGQTALPCVIADLSEREQMGIMLAENMQRVDLTVVEQAQSMQMMLDLGETVETVSDKTGLSQKTVKDRLKLNKLDQTALKKAVAKQVSLMDLLKLDKIENEEIRNKVLLTAGTNNFNEAYQKAISEQKTKARVVYMKELLAPWAKENNENICRDGRRWRCVISSSKAEEKIKEEIESLKKQYGHLNAEYKSEWNGITLYSDSTQEELFKKRKEDERSIPRKELECVWEQIKDLYAMHYHLRQDFIMRAKVKEWRAHILEDLLATYLIKRNTSFYSDAGSIFKELIGGKTLEEGLKKYQGKMDEVLIKLIYSEYSDSENRRHHEHQWQSGMWVVRQYQQSNLRDIYTFLCRFGYEMSDEEIALRDDTHPLLLRAKQIEEKIKQIEKGETT